MKTATYLKAECKIVALIIIVPDRCRSLQIKRAHHRAFRPAAGNLVLDCILEAAGKSRSVHTWDKWIRYRPAYVRI